MHQAHRMVEGGHGDHLRSEIMVVSVNRQRTTVGTTCAALEAKLGRLHCANHSLFHGVAFAFSHPCIYWRIHGTMYLHETCHCTPRQLPCFMHSNRYSSAVCRGLRTLSISLESQQIVAQFLVGNFFACKSLVIAVERPEGG